MVKDGRARMGQRLYVPMLDRTIAVTVTDPVFLDKDGSGCVPEISGGSLDP